MTLGVLVFTALAVFFLVVIAIEVLRQAYAEYERRYLSQKITDLSDMFFFVGPRQLGVLTIAATGLSVSLGLLLLGPVATFLLAIAGLLSPTLLVRFYRKRRVQLFERQLIDALGAMAAAMRAGMSLNQAMEEVSNSAAAPLSQELALTVREMRLGAPTDEALEAMAERVGSEDLALVTVAVITARSLGANLAEMFDGLARTIRERFEMEGRVRSLTAQGKLQGVIMGVMPLLLWFGFDAVRPDLTRPMLGHWFGYFVLSVVLILEGVGVFFIRRLTAIRV